MELIHSYRRSEKGQRVPSEELARDPGGWGVTLGLQDGPEQRRQTRDGHPEGKGQAVTTESFSTEGPTRA